MHRPLMFFAAAATPIPLILGGALWGGVWAVLALGYITLFTALLDHVIPPPAPPDSHPSFAADYLLPVLLALGHFAVLLAAVWTAGHGAPWANVLVFAAAGLFMGQVSNSNAHELIHRRPWALRALGKMIYISLLFGHHASAHVLVHHVHVATPRDPNSARLGEGFWRYAPRAWRGSFWAGLAAENQRMAQAQRGPWRHPYAHYIAGAALWIALMLALFGPWGLMVYLALVGHATTQLLLSDYVQHYGLRRAQLANGRYEPTGPMHSWNSPHRMSSAMMLNAPRHSDHHANPMRPYPALGLPPEGLMLPRSLPVMAVLALWPRQWRAVMDPRVPR